MRYFNVAGASQSGKIGEIIGASASFATHGVEGWHPNPLFYYKKGGGPLFDMGPYYLTALFKILGPVSEIISYSLPFSLI